MRNEKSIMRRHGAALTALRANLAHLPDVTRLGAFEVDHRQPSSSRAIATAVPAGALLYERRIARRQVMASAPAGVKLEVRTARARRAVCGAT